jgi:hypothetical protein
MKASQFALKGLVLAAVLFAAGCPYGLKSLKQSPAYNTVSQEGARPGEEQGRAADTEKKKAPSAKPPAPPPDYTPPPPPEDKAKDEKVDLSRKAEVSEAALAFAKGLPDVKHVKICHSRLYGKGWYLFIYAEKGKKIYLQQYSWNERVREWDANPLRIEVPREKLEHHLQVELDDEKCFVLK